MHSSVRPLATKILAWLACAAGLALLSGCDAVTLTDLTPKSMAENPSQIYTFSLRVAKRTSTVVGLTPNIVVDGKSFEMKPSPLGGGLHEFEYQLPAGRERLAYYFLVTYNVEGNGVLTPREAYTQRLIAAIPSDDVARIERRQADREAAAVRRAGSTVT